MQLRFIVSSSDDGQCPSIYETDRDTFVVQGMGVTTPETIAQARNLLDGEAFVEVPKELVRRIQALPRF
ncbi:hypothetical protein [Nonomuraea typhae]|uniref:Uncharacterized protein n=1 Tax=Nonomuraea typhae TaxID=2603600 RepID=A0ABW7YTF2_9ACTN